VGEVENENTCFKRRTSHRTVVTRPAGQPSIVEVANCLQAESPVSKLMRAARDGSDACVLWRISKVAHEALVTEPGLIHLPP